jgi:hypothetical protein
MMCTKKGMHVDKGLYVFTELYFYWSKIPDIAGPCTVQCYLKKLKVLHFIILYVLITFAILLHWFCFRYNNLAQSYILAEYK